MGGIFGRKRGPPPHVVNLNETLIAQQKLAIADAERRARDAISEAERLKAQQEAEIQRRVLSREPVSDAQLIKEAQQLFGIDIVNNYNFLVSGDTGAGKSSCINAILRRKPTETGAAKVGVSETTMEMSSFTSPESPSLILWDVPGAGTTAFPTFHPDNPDLHYYRRFKVYAFDCVIIFYSGRLLEGAANLAKLCIKARQPVAIVRNKADHMVDDLIDMGEANTEEDARALARRLFERELQEKIGDMPIPRFLVSIKHYVRGKNEFDEVALVEFVRQAAVARSERAAAAAS